MKKLLLSLFVITITSTAILAQKTINDPNVEKRAVDGFHGIAVGTGIELIIVEGNLEELAVSAATPEFRDKIITKVENGILRIYYESKIKSINKVKESKYLKAYVSYKTLDNLDATTGSEVKINGVLKASSMEMNANTGALINGVVDINTLKVNQSTGSKITLTGKAGKLIAEGNTGSRFKGDEMNTADCQVTVSTGALITVNAEKELIVKANTGGNVKYKGNAIKKEIKRSTGGSVTKI